MNEASFSGGEVIMAMGGRSIPRHLQEPLPPAPKKPAPLFRLKSRHRDDPKAEITIDGWDMEEVFSYHRQLAGIDYEIVTLERVAQE